MQNITLVGMPGAGKTTIGKLLAKRLGWEFVDTDALIIAEHRSLEALIARVGDAEFRNIEERTILSLQNRKHAIISPGGSVIYSPVSMSHLKAISTIVFLNVPLATIKARCEAGGRGIVGLKKKGWDALFAERLELYRQYADVELVPTGSTPDDNAAQVMKVIAI